MLVKKSLPRVLICDDDRNIHLALKSALGQHYDFKSAFHGDEALLILKKNQIDLVLLDMEIRTPSEGLDLIPRIREVQSETKIIIFSGRADFELVRNAMKLGAHDYVIKDSGASALEHVFKKAFEHKGLQTKQIQLQREIRTSAKEKVLIGKSPSIEKIRRQLERARLSQAPVLISGETGTGKEVLARLLRKTLEDGSFEPFVSVDSSTIQSSVAESVLFGYEKGAFTGAEKTTRGLFEEADGGCIYFDELGNMPLEIQNKLLRVIQEKEVLRIGSARPLALDFRVICATNRDLEALSSEGKFKDDLFQRLNVLQIHLPPLRERTEDIPELLEHFTEVHANGLERIRFLPETVALIQRHPFPGNIRELSNLVLNLYSMCDETMISPLDLPPRFQNPKAGAGPAKTATNGVDIDLSQSFYDAVEGFEKVYLGKAFSKFEGNVSKMASELGMDRSYLHRKLKNYGIHPLSKNE